MKKRILIGILALVVVAGVAIPWVLLDREKTSNETQAVLSSFYTQYGKEAKLIQITKPDSIYLTARENGGEVHASLLIGGIWVELGIIGTVNGEGK